MTTNGLIKLDVIIAQTKNCFAGTLMIILEFYHRLDDFMFL